MGGYAGLFLCCGSSSAGSVCVCVCGDVCFCVLLHVGGMLFECVLSESCFLTAILQFKGGFGAWLTVSMRLIQSHLCSLSSPTAHFFFILHNLAP